MDENPTKWLGIPDGSGPCLENKWSSKMLEGRHFTKSPNVSIAKIVRQMSAKHLCVSANLTRHSIYAEIAQLVEHLVEAQSA